jgi:hypothetical protein
MSEKKQWPRQSFEFLSTCLEGIGFRVCLASILFIDVSVQSGSGNGSLNKKKEQLARRVINPSVRNAK